MKIKMNRLIASGLFSLLFLHFGAFVIKERENGDGDNQNDSRNNPWIYTHVSSS